MLPCFEGAKGVPPKIFNVLEAHASQYLGPSVCLPVRSSQLVETKVAGNLAQLHCTVQSVHKQWGQSRVKQEYLYECRYCLRR